MKRSNGNDEMRSNHESSSDYRHSSDRDSYSSRKNSASASRDPSSANRDSGSRGSASTSRGSEQVPFSPPDNYVSTWRPSEFPRRSRGEQPPSSRDSGGGVRSGVGAEPYYSHRSQYPQDAERHKGHDAYYKRSSDNGGSSSTSKEYSHQKEPSHKPYYEYADRSRDYHHSRGSGSSQTQHQPYPPSQTYSSSHQSSASSYFSRPPPESPHYVSRSSSSTSYPQKPHHTPQSSRPPPYDAPRHSSSQHQPPAPPPSQPTPAKAYFSDSSYSSEDDDDEEDEENGKREEATEPKEKRKKKSPSDRRGANDDDDDIRRSMDDGGDYDSDSDRRFDQFPFGVPNRPVPGVAPPNGRRTWKVNYRGLDSRGRGRGAFNGGYSADNFDHRGRGRGRGRGRDRGSGPPPWIAAQQEEEEEEDQESELGSEPESEDDGRIVDDDNVNESWVWTRMFAMIKKRNWLKKAKEGDLQLTLKQEDSLKECDEDIEDVSVRTEERLDAVQKQIANLKEEMVNSKHPPSIIQRKLDLQTQEATAIQKRLDQWKDWLENGIEKKVPKKPFFQKAPRRGRNVFGKYDPSRFDEEAAFVPNKAKTPVAAVIPSSTPASSGQLPDSLVHPPAAATNLVRYPTVAYPGLAAVVKPQPAPIGGPGLVSYPVIGASLFPVVSRAISKADERDAISEMFDL